jgi:hypothetical protein
MPPRHHPETEPPLPQTVVPSTTTTDTAHGTSETTGADGEESAGQ